MSSPLFSFIGISYLQYQSNVPTGRLANVYHRQIPILRRDRCHSNLPGIWLDSPSNAQELPKKEPCYDTYTRQRANGSSTCQFPLLIHQTQLNVQALNVVISRDIGELFVNGLFHYIFHPFFYFMPFRIFIVKGMFFVILHNSSLSFLTVQALRI